MTKKKQELLEKGDDTLNRACKSIDRNYQRIHKQLTDQAAKVEQKSPGSLESNVADVGRVAAVLWHRGLSWAQTNFDDLLTAEKFKAIDAAMKAINTLVNFLPKEDTTQIAEFDRFMDNLAKKQRLTVIRKETIEKAENE